VMVADETGYEAEDVIGIADVEIVEPLRIPGLGAGHGLRGQTGGPLRP